MNAKDTILAKQLDEHLVRYHETIHQLVGIANNTMRSVLVRQLVESIRRIKYLSVVGSRDISPLRLDPGSDLFDPLRAAILCRKRGCFDEACWLVFLSTHFGKNGKSGWRLVRDVYGRLESGVLCDWERTSKDPDEFRQWLDENVTNLKSIDGIHRGFGNHRKYQSLSALSSNGTGAAIASYVHWVGPTCSHQTKFDTIILNASNDPRRVFDLLFESLAPVISFGRTARFDYLTMLAKVGLMPIEPGSTYLSGSTGPFKGAVLLFGSETASMPKKEIDSLLVQLGDYLGVGMQVIEDALCNWQKAPDSFKPFRG